MYDNMCMIIVIFKVSGSEAQPLSGGLLYFIRHIDVDVRAAFGQDHLDLHLLYPNVRKHCEEVELELVAAVRVH